MKTPKILTNIAEKARIAKLERHEKQINKLVNIENVTGEARGILYDAREVLANYAKANNIRINFKTYPKAHFTNVEGEGLRVGVIRTKEKMAIDCMVPATLEPLKTTKKNLVITTDKDGLNHLRTGVITEEDTLLRRIYKAVEYLTKQKI